MQANKNIAQFCETLDILNKQGYNIPGLIMSSPGSGKTSTVEYWCNHKDYNLVTVVATQYNQDDISGLQAVSTTSNKLEWLAPTWFNELNRVASNGKRTVLFLDEITACNEFIQAPLLRLIFSRKIGEGTLPENVFILSAGNYADELNGAFAMTAPLVNRFMVLNLTSEDYSITEVAKEAFQNLNKMSDVEISKYFGIEENQTPVYDYQKFCEWVVSSGELNYTSGKFTNDPEVGLLGFVSNRSLSYSLNFMRAYCDRFSGTLWGRVVGDTLGTSALKDNNKPLRYAILSAIATFKKVASDKNSTINELAHKELERRKAIEDSNGQFSLSTYHPEIFTELIDAIGNVDVNNLRRVDLQAIGELYTKYPEDKTIASFFSYFTKKLENQ